MPSAIEIKKSMKTKVMNMLNQVGTMQKDKVLSMLAVESGFKHETVETLLKDLENLGLIKIVGDELSLPKTIKQESG